VGDTRCRDGDLVIGPVGADLVALSDPARIPFWGRGRVTLWSRRDNQMTAGDSHDKRLGERKPALSLARHFTCPDTTESWSSGHQGSKNLRITPENTKKM
jgi:hypothetical protein